MNRHASSALPISLPPRGLQRRQAAEYVGVGVSKFDEMVKDGRMPEPAKIDILRIWIRPRLDEAMDALCNRPEANPWDIDSVGELG